MRCRFFIIKAAERNNMGRRYSGRRKRTRGGRVNIPLILGLICGFVGICGLAIILGSIVIGDNASICEKINLGGNLIGCQIDDEYSYDKIAIVTGNTKNTPIPELSKTASKYLTNSIVKNRDKLTIDIYSASSLHNRIRYTYNGIGKDEDTVEKLVEVVDTTRADIEEAIRTEPGANGAEYIETILRSAKALKGNAEKEDKLLMIVYGSGLSDGGLLDFTAGDPLHTNISEIISALNKSKELSEDRLSGITILWTSIGEVANPQSQLTESERQNLEEIYRTVLEEMGAKVLSFDIIDSADESIKTEYIVKPTGTKGVPCVWCEGKELLNDDLGFEANQWSISNEAVALEKLAPLISELKANSNEIVTITGYAARNGHCGEFGGSDIPQKRADYVKELLTRNGIAANRIITKNGGHGTRANECESGHWDDSLAQLNRYIEFKASIGERS